MHCFSGFWFDSAVGSVFSCSSFTLIFERKIRRWSDGHCSHYVCNRSEHFGKFFDSLYYNFIGHCKMNRKFTALPKYFNENPCNIKMLNFIRTYDVHSSEYSKEPTHNQNQYGKKSQRNNTIFIGTPSSRIHFMKWPMCSFSQKCTTDEEKT